MKERTQRFESVATADLPEIQRFVEDALAECGAEPQVAGELVVALHEAVTNVIRHGYRNKRGDLQVTVARAADEVHLQLVDSAPPFDPRQVPAPDTSLPLMQREAGGLGVHMMRAFTDGIEYRLTDDAHNELTLIKKTRTVDRPPAAE